MAPLGFLSFPGEIRNMIYRQLFCHPDPPHSLQNHRQWRGAQLLRTCRQIHYEGLPILYGENQFNIKISNTWGPFFSAASFDPAIKKKETHQYLRRISITIRYTEEHQLKLIRPAVREPVRWLQNCNLEFLELKCHLDCDNEYEEINWRHPIWDDYQVDGDLDECIGMIRTWLGRIRNVKEAAIEGMPEEDADELKARWLSQGPQPKTPTLADLYEILEDHVGESVFSCKYRLKKALLAAEDENIEEFEKQKKAIMEGARRLWEGLSQEELLQDGVTVCEG